MSASPLRLSSLQALALDVLYGARSGLLYGTKVRFPHSLVLTLLWAREKTASQKAQTIVRKTTEHALRLARFATLYKSAFYLLTSARSSERTRSLCGASAPGAPLAAALCGALAGGYVFRDPTSVNSQVLFFLLARTLVGGTKVVSQRWPPPPWLRRWAWRLYAAGCWGGVMALWEVEKGALAPSLRSSMEFIYADRTEQRGSRSVRDLLNPSSLLQSLCER